MTEWDGRPDELSGLPFSDASAALLRLDDGSSKLLADSYDELRRVNYRG
jgi:hypothetical protein